MGTRGLWLGLLLMVVGLDAAAFPSPALDVPDPPAHRPPAPPTSSIPKNEAKNTKSSTVQTIKMPQTAAKTHDEIKKAFDSGYPVMKTVRCGSQEGLCQDSQKLPLFHHDPQEPVKNSSDTASEHDSKLPESPGNLLKPIVKPSESGDQGQSLEETSAESQPEVTTTTIDPFIEFCQEMCREGIGGPECNCPGHPIGRRSVESRLLPVDFYKDDGRFSNVNHPRSHTNGRLSSIVYSRAEGTLTQAKRPKDESRLDLTMTDLSWGNDQLPKLLKSVWNKNHHLTVARPGRVMSPFCLLLCRRGWRNPSCRCHNFSSYRTKFSVVPSAQWPETT